MPGCGALHCRNRSEKGFKLYALPTGNRNKERRQLWAKYIGRDPLPEKAYICEVHFTSDQFELNRADGKKKLKWNAIPRIFAERKQCTKENIIKPPRVESNINPLPHTNLSSDVTKTSSSLLQDTGCGLFEQVNIVDSLKFTKEVFITSDVEDLESSKHIFRDYVKSRNGIFETTSEKQCSRPFDLSKVCRICFRKTQLENIFTAKYQEHTLHNLLELCSSVKINKNTKFKQICVGCKSQLIESYTFIRKVTASNNSLQFVELNNKKSSHLPEDEMEEIFIFVDQYNKPIEICNEISEQDFSNSLLKFGKSIITNVNNNRECDSEKTSQKYESEGTKIDKINEGTIRRTPNSFQMLLQPTQNEHIFEINDLSASDENNISQYYLIKADENTTEDFTHKESIFQVSEEEITKVVPNLIATTETTNHAAANTNFESSELEAEKTPVQNIVHLQDHTYVDKCKEKLNSSEDKISLLCEKCGLQLSSISNLRTHIKRLHEGIRTYNRRCQKCNIVFRSQASYETHRSQHVGKYHCCETCGKMFAGMAHLRQHLRRHSTLRPYACNICSKSFRARYLLKYHVTRHLKEKKHVCPICNGSFVKISDLRSHIAKAHPERTRPKLFTCEKCDYKSFKKRALQIHLKKTHDLT